MGGLTIGKVAKKVGIGIETIRYYERQGLIEPAPRKASGYRHYPKDVVSRLMFIRRAKQLGFSLREIRELLTLRYDPAATCADVKKKAEVKIADIEEKMRNLEVMKKALEKLITACSGTGPLAGCSILEALERKEDVE